MTENKLVVSDKEKAALVIDQADNVAVTLTDLQKGDICTIRSGEQEEKILVIENIPFGHKIAIQSLSKDDSVYKYGEEIGKMKEPIEKGGWIHSHNLYCERGLKNGR